MLRNIIVHLLAIKMPKKAATFFSGKTVLFHKILGNVNDHNNVNYRNNYT